MNKINLKYLAAVLLSMIISTSKAQFHFGVAPGLQLNGAVFGYQVKKFVPYLSLQMMSGSINYTQTGKKEDPNTGNIVDYKDIYKASGTVYMPSIGCKYFFMERDKLKAYANLSLTKFMVSAKIEDTNNPSAPVDLKKVLDNISLYGGQTGFGAEYFFDQNFSVGGEFGLRLLHVNFKEEHTETLYDQNTNDYVNTTITSTTKLNFNPTYTRFSLNFYFGK